ncbi:N-acetyltransferase [Lusitaniella coriacea LEGE 07157]|uniref:N-acetyltransferase n=1 Tax=Lusitaniella coriacea LEGE 07157 TaxID=945747 RepID=A0A8J7DVL8_9CYAN|nr:GNAT family N-acetyltransferase [Lusitaniella coriacea]MBE9115867.1 N-acetyltransferase [Lusitaniella coriacea LEGE 07157]
MIRDATEADLPAIVGIYNASIPSRMATADTEPLSPESRLDWFRTHHPQKYPLWVIELNGEVVAWLSFRPFYGRPAYKSTVEISLYVDPEYHRQGFGRQLLQQAIADSPGFGFNTLVAFIFAHNEPSLRLFEQLSFREWGYLPGVAKFGEVECDLTIQGQRLSF